MTFQDVFDLCDRQISSDVFSRMDMNSRSKLELRIDMETSAFFREKYVLALRGHNVSIYGDEAWKAVIPEHFSFGGKINYEDDVGALYSMSKINLNVTRTQIQTGVNQRVLDSAAAGSVFLTDFRETTQEFFDCDVSPMMYGNENELKEKAACWTAADKEREKAGRALYRSVYDRHTYDHRMKEMLEIFEKLV
jgi:spore maturation protein CgeB